MKKIENPDPCDVCVWSLYAKFTIERLGADLSNALLENERLREALRRISTMRPAGDVATATGTRALVQRVEATALQALSHRKAEG